MDLQTKNENETNEVDTSDNWSDFTLKSNNTKEEKYTYDELQTKFNDFKSNLEPTSNFVNNNAKRKDTKDSGYGDALSEHEDEQEAIPEWCRQYQATASEDVRSDVNDDKSSDYQYQLVIKEDCGSKDDEKPITDASKKHAKRHRKNTPVPISAPLILSVVSKPDCLFVEEEDAEDLKDFNSENDFLDQGFISQMADSPKWKHKVLQNTATLDDADIRLSCGAPENSKIFMRSKSENIASKTRVNFDDFHEVPSIELVPPTMLPTWMQEATQCNTSCEEKSNSTDLTAFQDKCNSSLCTNWSKQNEASKKVDISEDVLRLYMPPKEEKMKKGSRVRKLTPVRPTSPSLDKLTDLQRQVSGSSLMEDDVNNDSEDDIQVEE